MKYEEIKDKESYMVEGDVEKVIAKSDEYKAVMTVDESYNVSSWNGNELEDFKPLPKDLLDKVTEVVNEFGNHIIEQTESGVILISKIK